MIALLFTLGLTVDGLVGVHVGWAQHIIALGYYEIIDFGKVGSLRYHKLTKLTPPDVVGWPSPFRQRNYRRQNLNPLLLPPHLPSPDFPTRCHNNRLPPSSMVDQLPICPHFCLQSYPILLE